MKYDLHEIEADLIAFSREESVDLNKLLETAGQHFGEATIIPHTEPLSSAELDELIEDDGYFFDDMSTQKGR